MSQWNSGVSQKGIFTMRIVSGNVSCCSFWRWQPAADLGCLIEAGNMVNLLICLLDAGEAGWLTVVVLAVHST